MSKNRLENSKEETFALGKENYKLIVIVWLPLHRFYLMTGGPSDPTVFTPKYSVFAEPWLHNCFWWLYLFDLMPS